MRHQFKLAAAIASALTATALAASNIDPAFRYAWSENAGWTNWRDAGSPHGTQGVALGTKFLSGYVWAENTGWINLGNGAGPYNNTNDTNYGVNLASSGILSGYAWAENVGWINFSGGAIASPPQPARLDCIGRFNGWVWAENIGWLNLADAALYVRLDSATAPISCDVNHDGVINGQDVQTFIQLFLQGGATWRDTCSGDVGSPPDGSIGIEDVAAFATCLLS